MDKGLCQCFPEWGIPGKGCISVALSDRLDILPLLLHCQHAIGMSLPEWA